MTDLTPNHPAVEVLARHLADLEPGDPWPTNAELGGHPLLGTRDDEFRFAMLETANEILSELIPHLTAASQENLARLRDTPVGRALMAEAWEEAIFGTKVWKYLTETPSNPYRKGETDALA